MPATARRPEPWIDPKHVAEDVVILEVIITGTHLGSWHGLPATGRRIRFPLCAVFGFEGDKIAYERIYYDQATVLQQLGVLHDPDSVFGRAVAAITHPVTIGRAIGRAVRLGRTARR